MNKISIAINGFGRIGRLVFRAAVNNPNINIVGINDLIDANYMSYMLRYDTTHGRFNGEVSVDGKDLVVNGNKIRVTTYANNHLDAARTLNTKPFLVHLIKDNNVIVK